MFKIINKSTKKSAKTYDEEDTVLKSQQTQLEKGQFFPCPECELCWTDLCIGGLYGCASCLSETCGSRDCCYDDC